MSHTPGPWFVGGESGNEGEAEEIAAKSRTIAWTANTYSDAADEDFTTDEDRANGRLIAAAPDLLAALQALLHQVYQMRGMFPDEDGTIAAAIQDAEDAIKQTRQPT